MNIIIATGINYKPDRNLLEVVVEWFGTIVDILDLV
jgi:hypothetical protein